MNNTIKKIIGIIVFLAIVFVPLFLILLFVDELHAFNATVIYIGVVIFTIWGYMIISMRNMTREVHDAVESMKMQNAAIAYKLTMAEKISEFETKSDKDKKGKGKNDKSDKDEDKVDIMKINLNPEEPLFPTKKKGNKSKKIDDNYDDFK